MFSEEKLSQAGQKQQSISIKSLYWSIFNGFESKENFISKLTIKMTIKRKTRAEKAYGYRLLLSFKTLVTYNFFLTSHRTTVPVVKQLSPDITRYFAGHCPMSGSNIQARY